MKNLCKGAFRKHHPYSHLSKSQPAFSRLGISKCFRCFPKASHRECCRNRLTNAHCFRPNAIFAVKGIKLRVGSRKNPVAQQEGGLSVTKDRSAKALTQPVRWEKRGQKSKSFVCRLQNQKIVQSDIWCKKRYEFRNHLHTDSFYVLS